MKQHSPLDSDTNPMSSRTLKSWQKPLTYLSLVLLGSGMTLAGTHTLSRSPLPLLEQSAIAQAPNRALTPTNGNFVTQVVQDVGPAVVRIDASRRVSRRVPQAFNDPALREFFGDRLPATPNEREVRGAGSGFILNSNGEILTNAHVIDGADRVTVTLRDGREYEGRVLGTDPITDVAVVKIDANNLPTVRVGDAERLQPGEWAIAIGNPLGLDNTVTVGIISATGRSSSQIGVPDKRVSFIQTDAAINPGNSGGPLLNQSGEVIGMNTAILRNAQGLGFSIPINTAQRIAQELIANGSVQHPYLGVQMLTLTPQVRESINNNPNSGLIVQDDRGVLVTRVMPNSPASQAGLQAGDIILRIGDREVSDASGVQQAVEATQVGSTLPLELRRNGRTVNLNVRAGAFPNQNS
ncbi:trypsin-like peptidase domain-containing protein [Desertifilum sp. FACHB-1129]|uniref:Serine protease n=2 Tax=Desertifilum TaxID=1185872 RepID=A0A1E5QM12_9CYAN|nr:HhoA/HhoB/HtrA family serine endopeptidase [Desertifilum tharense]MBD2313704.1 trypsin-like peptidase domain-containing protein [Desertifilum sp. FACHB-1129]MBD2324998.1 trypsin-like peptidase domain-containing protein [Desertifilum sp. FACHB-866]MBD2335137.1 trypsin-like peptidase domain-containing protein [Desertifilum sp. FACHB-868]OEJ75732.1 serine protease [Desertifilum tharense IPPAS B-1220]